MSPCWQREQGFALLSGKGRSLRRVIFWETVLFLNQTKLKGKCYKVLAEELAIVGNSKRKFNNLQCEFDILWNPPSPWWHIENGIIIVVEFVCIAVLCWNAYGWRFSHFEVSRPNVSNWCNFNQTSQSSSFTGQRWLYLRYVKAFQGHAVKLSFPMRKCMFEFKALWKSIWSYCR